MVVIDSESAELDAYQLQDRSHSGFNQWKAEKEDDAGPIEWKEFATVFLNRFFPLELREAKVLDFINLKQGNMTVKEYSLKFT